MTHREPIQEVKTAMKQATNLRDDERYTFLYPAIPIKKSTNESSVGAGTRSETMSAYINKKDRLGWIVGSRRGGGNRI